MKLKFTFLFVAFFSSMLVSANNITVANALLNGQNTTADTEVINFDVAWENGWRTSTNENNYDGAWIFVKYRKMGTLDWRHCTIASTGFTPGSGAAFFIPADRKGAFIYRSADGVGNVNFLANKLIWEYGTDGVLDNETVEIRVFALEMVYIPGGVFQLGSGGTESNAFENGTSGTPYSVSSNAAITVGTASGNLNSSGKGIATGSIPAAYPKGFAAFWIMKYETSQQQFVDFLNNIDQVRANAIFPFAAPLAGTHPNYTALQPERAMNACNELRLASIADWSALRPFSELEFEKACRGFNTPAVANEYVWGNTTQVSANSMNDVGLSTESVNTPANANSNIASALGLPVRVGVFARPTGSSRALSGGTYYGLMNMGDNVYEQTFAITTQGLLASETVHGDGYLDNSGATNIVAWQAATAYGIRGGAFQSGTANVRTSDRVASTATQTYGIGPVGIRMARTAL